MLGTGPTAASTLPRYAADSCSARSAGVPTAVISPCTMIAASSATPEHGLRELLDDEDRHAFARDVRDDLVQLFDDDRRQSHRQLVEQEQRGIGGEPARHREHLLLAAARACPRAGAPFGRDAGSARTRSPRSRAVTGPVNVDMRRFSRTVRFGKIPLPSGTRQSPARASSSGRAPLTRRPATNRSPAVGAIRPHATFSVVDFPAPFGPRIASDLAGGDDEVDAVHDFDAAVRGLDAAQLEQRRLDVGDGPASRLMSPPGCSPRYAASTASSVRIVLRVADRDDAAEVEHVDEVAHLHDEVHVVLDEQHRDAFARERTQAARRADPTLARRGPTPARRAAAHAAGSRARARSPPVGPGPSAARRRDRRCGRRARRAR